MGGRSGCSEGEVMKWERGSICKNVDVSAKIHAAGMKIIYTNI